MNLSKIAEKFINRGRSGVLLCCSFCGKSHRQIKQLIAGPNGIYICNECIEICNEIIKTDVLAQRESQPLSE